MSGHKPYYIEEDKFHTGEDGIIIPDESSLRVHPTAKEEREVSNNHILMHFLQQLTLKQAIDDVGRCIYPEPAAQGTCDAQGRLAGYIHGDEQVPQSEEQEEECPPQEPHSEHAHSYSDEHGRLYDRNGRCLDDGQAPQPRSLEAVAPSATNERMPQHSGGMSFPYPALSAGPPSGASCLAFQAPIARMRMAPDTNANVDPLLLDLDSFAASEGDRLNPSSSRQQSSKLIEPSMFKVYKCSLSPNEPHGTYPELPSADTLPSGPVNVAARPNSGTAASNLNATRQQYGWTATPPPQQQQQTSGPHVNAPRVYGQGAQYGSSYGQHLLPPLPGIINPAVRQRDGSQLLPQQQQQQASGLAITAPSVSGQDLPYKIPNNGHPHLSSSDSLAPDAAFSLQYIRDNHLSLAAYPLVYAAYKGYLHLSRSDPSPEEDAFTAQFMRDNPISPWDPPVVATYINNYHAARDIILNGPVNNGAFCGTFTGSHTFGHQPQQQPPLPPNPAGAHQPNNAFAFDQPNHVYNNPFHNNQARHPSYARTAPALPTTTPVGPVKQDSTSARLPGELVNTPLTPSARLLADALRALPQVNTNGMHPSRSSLKKPFASIDVATPGQLSVRKNFLSGYGTFQPKAELLKWYGDEAVFPKVFWKFLVEGEPRPNGVKKKRAGGSEEPPRAKRQKNEEAEKEDEE
jgi:hypothetical protein